MSPMHNEHDPQTTPFNDPWSPPTAPDQPEHPLPSWSLDDASAERPAAEQAAASSAPAAPQQTSWAQDSAADQPASTTAMPTASETPQPGRRGPGWLGVTAMVAAGMVLSSGVTLGGVLTYDALTAEHEQPTASATAASDQPPIQPVASRQNVDWTAVAQKVSAGTVAIRVQDGDSSSQGTGVVSSTDGTIITNNHVVGSAKTAHVTFTSGLTYSATVIGTDPSTDIAVLRLDKPPKDLTPLTFGDSSRMSVGESVMAVGTPLGLDNTVTTGIISAVDRPVTAGGKDGEASETTYTSALQTDAAINPGNSGGPLVNAAGEVIGINSSIAALPGQGSSAGSIGLGFAIPSNTVTMIADQLVSTGRVQHAFLGVTTQDAQATSGDVTYTGAKVVDVVPDSAAQDAGFETGDLVTAVDDVPVDGAAGLTGIVRGLPVGSEHTVTVLRDGKEIPLKVTLSTRP